MKERATLLGGPLDGGVIAGRHDPFVYVAGDRALRGFLADGPGRQLYRRIGDGLFLYAGHTHLQCPECGTMLSRDLPVCLCGRPTR